MRAEIETVRTTLSLSQDDFRPLKPGEWQQVQKNVIRAFLYDDRDTKYFSWQGNALKVDNEGIGCNRNPYDRLGCLLDEEKRVYFYVNETVNERTRYWFYEGTADAVLAVLAETMCLDEYYFVSKKYQWLLYCNHHDILVGTGSMIPKLMANKEWIATGKKS